MTRLPPKAEIDWIDGAPSARAFGDIYFSRDGGLRESESVFLTGGGLPDAWQGRDRFAICELGFGSGLNVLSAWRVWRTTRQPHAILHISSIEAFPLARDDAARALRNFSEVAPLAAKLLECWPVRAPAPQRLWFPEDGFALTLHSGPAEAILASMHARFDAWFLDGFAPAHNPDMWTEAIIAHVARLSAPGARLATFTVAGHVRRALERAGFTVEKKPGFGAKRERLEARLDGAAQVACAPKRVAIGGAGIAGAACAQALSRRGVEAIVLETATSLGAGASGNPAGLVMPRLDRSGALSEVFLAAYLHAVAAYETLGVIDMCGVEERARLNNAEALADLIADPPLPDDWIASLPNGCALHKRAGLVRPLAAIDQMLSDASVLFEAEVGSIEQGESGFTVRAPDGRARVRADAIVLACGAALANFEPAAFLPIQLSLGQVEWGSLGGEAPQRALVQGNYVAPFDGGVLFGATFDNVTHIGDLHADDAARRRNLDALEFLAPDIAERIDLGSLRSRAAIRATTQDRAPVAGKLPNSEQWSLERDARHEGLYVLGGLGARGLVLAPLLGELIASSMFDEPQVLSQPALDAVDPARFLRRRARRGG